MYACVMEHDRTVCGRSGEPSVMNTGQSGEAVICSSRSAFGDDWMNEKEVLSFFPLLQAAMNSRDDVPSRDKLAERFDYEVDLKMRRLQVVYLNNFTSRLHVSVG